MTRSCAVPTSGDHTGATPSAKHCSLPPGTPSGFPTVSVWAKERRGVPEPKAGPGPGALLWLRCGPGGATAAVSRTPRLWLGTLRKAVLSGDI